MRALTILISLPPMLAVMACAEAEVTAPEAEAEVDVPLTVTLVAPGPEIRMPQNVPTLGCPPNPTRGYGLRIAFTWTAPESLDDVSGYHLHVQREGSSFPLVDTLVSEPAFTLTSCNAFVIDANLEGWSWRVRVIDAAGAPGAQSETRAFAFQPCRLIDGRPCHALPEGL